MCNRAAQDRNRMIEKLLEQYSRETIDRELPFTP
jgi:hypothetical protein